MGHATLALLLIRAVPAILLATALCRIQGLVDSDDDVRHRHLMRWASQVITAAWTTHGFYDFMPAQFSEQLLQIRQGNFLALADSRKRHRSIVLAHCQVNHRSYGKTAFCCQTHETSTL